MNHPSTQERPPMSCGKCGKAPGDIEEYVIFGGFEDMSAEDFCWDNEGTLDRRTGRFLCTNCYIAVGMPTLPGPGWTATPANLLALHLS